jgi:hypothetical protein
LDVWELYDLENDPKELNNIYGDPAYAAIQKELHTELEGLRIRYEDNDALNEKFIQEYNEKVKNNPLVEYWKITPEDRQRLYQEYLKSGKQ